MYGMFLNNSFNRDFESLYQITDPSTTLYRVKILIGHQSHSIKKSTLFLCCNKTEIYVSWVVSKLNYT